MTTRRLEYRSEIWDKKRLTFVCLVLPLALALVGLLLIVTLSEANATRHRQFRLVAQSSQLLDQTVASFLQTQTISSESRENLTRRMEQLLDEAGCSSSPRASVALARAGSCIEDLVTVLHHGGSNQIARGVNGLAFSAQTALTQARSTLHAETGIARSQILGTSWIVLILVGLALTSSWFLLVRPLLATLDYAESDLGVCLEALSAQTEAAASLQTSLSQYRSQARDLSIDLTDLRRIHDASAHRFNALFQGLVLPTFTVNDLGRLVEWNYAAAEFFGVLTYQVIDRSLTEVINPIDGEEVVIDRLRQLAGGGRPDAKEVTLLLPGGKRVDVEWMSFPVRDLDGMVVGSLHALRDLTDIFRLRNELTAAKKSLEMMEERSGAVLSLFQASSWYHGKGSERILTLLGYSKEATREYADNLLIHILHPKDAAEITRVSRARLGENGDQPQTAKIRLRRPDGSYQWVTSVETMISRSIQGDPDIIAGYLTFGKIVGQVIQLTQNEAA